MNKISTILLQARAASRVVGFEYECSDWASTWYIIEKVSKLYRKSHNDHGEKKNQMLLKKMGDDIKYVSSNWITL